MASSWAASWGTSWGVSWDGAALPVVVDNQPGGGYYRRPIIYLDDQGRPVDLKEHNKPRPEPEWQPPVIPLDVLEALSFPMQPDQSTGLAEMLAMARQRLASGEFERVHRVMKARQDEDDEALVLLLS